MNEYDQYILLHESSKEEGFSSIAHSTQLLADEIRPFLPQTVYSIPDRYMADALVLMPVNLDTVFVYWEITPELFLKYPAMNHDLKTKIVALEDERELVEFSIKHDLGNYYAHVDTAMKHLQARMGFYDSSNTFVVVMTSNVFIMPNDRIELSDDEIWMNMDEHTREILLSSMEEKIPSLSSSELIKRGK